MLENRGFNQLKIVKTGPCCPPACQKLNSSLKSLQHRKMTQVGFLPLNGYFTPWSPQEESVSQHNRKPPCKNESSTIRIHNCFTFHSSEWKFMYLRINTNFSHRCILCPRFYEYVIGKKPAHKWTDKWSILHWHLCAFEKRICPCLSVSKNTIRVSIWHLVRTHE